MAAPDLFTGRSLVRLSSRFISITVLCSLVSWHFSSIFSRSVTTSCHVAKRWHSREYRRRKSVGVDVISRSAGGVVSCDTVAVKMGRKKIQISRIGDERNRQVSWPSSHNIYSKHLYFKQNNKRNSTIANRSRVSCWSPKWHSKVTQSRHGSIERVWIFLYCRSIVTMALSCILSDI